MSSAPTRTPARSPAAAVGCTSPTCECTCAAPSPTPTGRLRHLSAWWLNRPAAACNAGGTYRMLEWDETDDRPLCARCLGAWRRHVELATEWAAERLDDLEARG